MNDEGGLRRGSDFVYYELDEFIPILQEKNIPITEIRGPREAFYDDGGSIRFDDTNWEYDLLKKINSK